MHSTAHDANTWNLPTSAERRTMQRKLIARARSQAVAPTLFQRFVHWLNQSI
jgi:hypothetical protein